MLANAEWPWDHGKPRLDWMIHPEDISAGDQFKSEFLALHSRRYPGTQGCDGVAVLADGQNWDRRPARIIISADVRRRISS
ncbi:thioredoxin domain-containing protein [Gluconacetobacter tumulisoli]|uniref:Uncharacterized protein n=1 Tax=Gluconacetobacter tumulisoli TaxID=1286189 RepID=A0A7W4PLA0_9PROT|nr:hypothetical protein [Gluconacetobacter tumulisoli]